MGICDSVLSSHRAWGGCCPSAFPSSFISGLLSGSHIPAQLLVALPYGPADPWTQCCAVCKPPFPPQVVFMFRELMTINKADFNLIGFFFPRPEHQREHQSVQHERLQSA